MAQNQFIWYDYLHIHHLIFLVMKECWILSLVWPILWKSFSHTSIKVVWPKVYEKMFFLPVYMQLQIPLKDIDIGILAHSRPSDMAQHLEYVGCSYFTQFQLLNNGLKLLCFTFYWWSQISRFLKKLNLYKGPHRNNLLIFGPEFFAPKLSVISVHEILEIVLPILWFLCYII